MNCREFLAGLRRVAPAIDPDARRHAASCPACASEERGAILLRLGSDRAEDAAPRAGFEERLRARLDGAAAEAPSWTSGLDSLARPALALATVVMALCVVLYARSATPPADPADPADLASLFEADPVLGSLLGTPEVR